MLVILLIQKNLQLMHAARSVGAVTGADILKAMIKEGCDAVKLASSKNAVAAPKDGTIADAIALRSMAKGGKFVNASEG